MNDTASTNETLPASIGPDWELIRERYLAGDEVQDIAEACGTTPNAISCKAYQQGWKAEALRAICEDEALVTHDVRLNLIVSVYREARMLGRMSPSRNAGEADAWSKVRERCIAAASKLLRWEEDPVQRAKLAKCLDL